MHQLKIEKATGEEGVRLSVDRTLANRLAKLEAARPFVLAARTPEEADRLIAEHKGGPVVVAPPVAASVDA